MHNCDEYTIEELTDGKCIDRHNLHYQTREKSKHIVLQEHLLSSWLNDAAANIGPDRLSNLTTEIDQRIVKPCLLRIPPKLRLKNTSCLIIAASGPSHTDAINSHRENEEQNVQVISFELRDQIFLFSFIFNV